MPSYSIKLKESREIAENTMAFYFEKPPGFHFIAGQFVALTLLSPAETDAKGNRRNFTIASAPHEQDLMIATRIRDTAFKRNLRRMPIGTEVKILGPFGDLTLQGVSGSVVFLTGGIGITPFRSMALQATHDQWQHPLFLFYSNRRPEDAAFLEELRALEPKNPHYKFIATMTAMEKSKHAWRGETGLIDRTMLGKFLDDFGAPVYYIAGPPAMVAAMQQMLKENGVAKDRIRDEEFAGY